MNGGITPFDPSGPVLVTGAGGRIGRAILAYLLERNIPVRAVDKLPAHVGHPGLAWFEGRADDVDLLRRAMPGCAAVVHLAGITHWAYGGFGEVLGANLAGTASVIDEAMSAGITRVVIASSIQANGVEGNPRTSLPSEYPIRVETPSVAVDGYSLSKLYSEDLARRVTAGTATRVVSLRFPLTVAEEHLRDVAEEWRANPALGVALGWSYLDVRDAARAIAGALAAPTIATGPLLVAAPRNLLRENTEDLLDRFAPKVVRLRRFADDEVPIDLRPAEDALAFRATFEI